MHGKQPLTTRMRHYCAFSCHLRRWKFIADDLCGICGLTQNLKHVLCCCSLSLNQGRYRWRHNKILYALQEDIQKQITFRRTQKLKTHHMPFIQFVRAGESPSRCKCYVWKALINCCLDEGQWILATDHQTSLVKIHTALH